MGARAASFADALVADAYDANTIYSNPAALAYLERSSAILNHSQERLINQMAENIVVPITARNAEALVIGLTLGHVGYLDLGTTSDFKVIQYGYDLAYAREISPTVSLGASINVRYARSSSSNTWGTSSSLGIFYVPSQQVSYGAVVGGLGSGILYNSDRVTTTLSSENLPRTLQVGLEMRFPEGPKPRLVTIALSNEKLFGTDGIRYKGGVELHLLKYLALRGGYFVEPGLQAPRFGVGFHSDRFQADVGGSTSKLTDRAFFFSFSLVFSGQSATQ